jgi:hypothetical protein
VGGMNLTDAISKNFIPSIVIDNLSVLQNVQILSVKKYHLFTAEKKFWIPPFLLERRQRDAAPSTAFLNRQYFMQMCISFYFYVRQKKLLLCLKIFLSLKKKNRISHPPPL